MNEKRLIQDYARELFEHPYVQEQPIVVQNMIIHTCVYCELTIDEFIKASLALLFDYQSDFEKEIGKENLEDDEHMAQAKHRMMMKVTQFITNVERISKETDRIEESKKVNDEFKRIAGIL